MTWLRLSLVMAFAVGLAACDTLSGSSGTSSDSGFWGRGGTATAPTDMNRTQSPGWQTGATRGSGTDRDGGNGSGGPGN